MTIAGRHILYTRLCRTPLACVLGLLVFLSSPALSAISVDTVSTASGSTASLTWSHTVHSGSNRILIVGVSNRDGNKTVSNVTYGGTGLTLIGFQNSGGNSARMEMWRLIAPPQGTASVVVTLSGSVAVTGGAASFFGVDQTTPLGTFASALGTGLTASVTVTSATNELVVDVVTATGDAVSLTAGSGQTVRWNTGTGTAGGDVRGASSTKSGAPSVAMSWTLENSKAWAIGAIPLKPVGYSIAGSVFEDVNYGGGAGRNWTTASGNGGSARQGARVELFSGGTFSASTTTDGSGNYSFTGLAAGNYCVRVVSSSVTGSRTGYDASCLPVMTFKTDTSGGSIVDVPNFVGGHDPSTADAGNAATGWTLTPSTGAFGGSGSGKAHAFSCAKIGSSNVTGVDFGFNFNTISNTNNTGQGSLRQFITNANTLGGDASLAQSGLVAGKDNAVFMISNGSPSAGLRSSINYFIGGVATISPASALPTISTVVVLDAQKQPGWTSAPIIELNGAGAGASQNGLTVSGGASIIRGFIINRFTNHGIYLITSGADIVQGNYVGTDAAGIAASANGAHGIFANSIPNTLIGGTTAAARNVASGNAAYGIVIAGASATGNTVSGNYVGVNAAGTAAVANLIGVDVEGAATGNTVGGTSAAARNVISGNTQMGMLLQFAGTSGNTVAGNYIGTNAFGSAAIPNGTYGVNVKNSASGNTVGGTTGTAGNLVSGNTGSGIAIEGTAASGNVVQGNYVGLNAAGTAAIPNVSHGVYLNGAPSNTIGGTTSSERNIISGNSSNGLYLFGAGATGNSVKGNYIGTNAAGSAAVANGGCGVQLEAAGAGNMIGGTAAGAGNVISGNTNHGLWLYSSTTGAIVQGNYIGTNAAGTGAIANQVHGVTISAGTTNNTVGGTTSSARNVISGNLIAGVRLQGVTTAGNTIQGNYIGVDVNGTGALGNGSFGVIVDGTNTSVGGTVAGSGNLIANNGSDGVAVVNTSVGNSIQGNSTYSNGGLGIDLGDNGVTINNGTKSASLPNYDMDYPVFTVAVLNGTSLHVIGYVGSSPSQSTFGNARIEIFKSSNDASGYGEGQTYLAFITAHSDGNFDTTITVSGLTLGDKITATATDGSNNTSEFGPNIAAVNYSISGNVFEDVNYGGGAGRSKAASGGISRSGARVELFDAGGNFSSSTTTDGSGNYTFSGLSAATYYVRVVNDSVSSSRAGYTTSLKCVMTYRTNAATGTAVPVTDYVGGQNPSIADAVRAASGWTLNTATGAFGGNGSGTAQSFSQVTLTSGGVTGVDFGFNFNTIVNTNNAGQGSLRQFIINANTLGGDASLAQSGLVAGKENAVFMISNGTASAGLRSSINYFSGGVATVSPTTPLPVISTVVVLDAQRQPGWSSAPVIELSGASAGSGARGLEPSAGNSVVRGFVINRFAGSSNSAGIWISGAGQDTVQGNYLGTNAAGSAASANYQGIWIEANISSNVIGGSVASQRNVISGNTWRGIWVNTGSSGNKIRGNYVGLNASGTAAVANQIGIYIMQAPDNTVGGTGAGEGNVVSGNSFYGLYLVYPQASGNVVQGNTIGLNAARSAAVPNGSSGIEICCSGAGATNSTIGGAAAGAANVISGNTGSGILMRGGTGNAILTNSIYGNGGIGIDLGADNVTANNGTKNASLPNYDMDYPVFMSATLSGTTLTVAGYVGSAANQSTFASARVEIFKSDNDATGYGEGQTYLGFLTADANGNFSGSLTVAGVALGDRITGTATDASSNTSEFGPNFTITGVKIVSTATGGNWSVGSTWVGGVVPTADNPVDIVSGATVTLDGNITRNAADTLSVYGTLNCGVNIVSGAGPFTLAAGGTLGIGDPAGISASAAAGNIQVSGTRSFSTGASYTYNGSSAQSTGNGLPSIVNNLTVNNNAAVTLTGSETVNGALMLTNGALGIGANTLTLNGNVSAASGSLTSGATGTVIYNRSSDGQAVLAANYGNLAFSNFNKTLASSGTIGIAGTFTPGSAAAHTVTGSTIAFNGSGAQAIPAWSYNNLTLGVGGTKTAGGNLALAGTLTIGSSVTFDAGSFTHTVQGDWSNSGTFVAGTSTIQMSGGSNAAISGTNTFNVLAINKAASSTTVTLNNSITVGTLNMTQGTMLTGSNSVTITGDRTGNGVITGTITRTHTFVAGIAYAFESPFSTMTFASGGTLPGSVTMTVVLGSPGANSSMEPIDRYYDLSQTGGSGFIYTLRLHYEDAEVTAPNSETSPPLQLWRRISAGPDVWERKGATANNTTSNWVEASGQTDLGRWTLSSRTVPNVVLTMAQSDAHPSPGQIVTYTIAYNNNGDGPAGTVLVTASAPANTSYVPGNTALNGVFKTDQSGDDEVTVAGSTITINLGTVAAGTAGTITYKVTIQ